MAFKKRLLALFCIGTLAMAANSCKKDNQDFLFHYLTAQPWELASVQVTTYIGSQQISSVILDDCALSQSFVFNADNTCSYANFACKSNTAKGSWQFGEGRIYLNSDIQCADTTLDGTARDTLNHPFTNAKIQNLGSYSFVLTLGDGYYTSTTRRVIRQLSFVHLQ